MDQEGKTLIIDWVKDYENRDVFFNDDGFITYKISDTDSAVYVGNFFIPPLKRNAKKGLFLMRSFIDYMIEARPDIHSLVGDVQLNLPNAMKKLTFFGQMGAEIWCADNKAIAVIYDLTKGSIKMKKAGEWSG